MGFPNYPSNGHLQFILYVKSWTVRLELFVIFNADSVEVVRGVELIWSLSKETLVSGEKNLVNEIFWTLILKKEIGKHFI